MTPKETGSTERHGETEKTAPPGRARESAPPGVEAVRRGERSSRRCGRTMTAYEAASDTPAECACGAGNAADHHADFHAELAHLAHLVGHPGNHLDINAAVTRAHQRLAAEFEENALEGWTEFRHRVAGRRAPLRLQQRSFLISFPGPRPAQSVQSA